MKTEKINRHSRYLEIFLTSRCSPQLLGYNLFPNAKEITESYGMFNATEHLSYSFAWNNPNITAVVIGDGSKPRTGATFAFRTNWNVISIDPNLPNLMYDIKRLTLFRKKIEDFEFDSVGPLLIVMPHSHAPMKACLENVRGKERSVITMDCCFNNDIVGVKPDFDYRDENVWSKMNRIKIWTNI